MNELDIVATAAFYVVVMLCVALVIAVAFDVGSWPDIGDEAMIAALTALIVGMVLGVLSSAIGGR